MAYFDKYGVEYSDDKKTIIRCPETLTGEYTILEGVSKIEIFAFAVSKLSKIYIPQGVIEIGSDAFNGCTNLRSITIPWTVEKIGVSAFIHCPRLKAIYVDKNNKNYCSLDGILFSKDKSKLILCPPKAISSTYNVPQVVTIIDCHAFTRCSNLKTIYIPQSVTKIGKLAFCYCNSLHALMVPKGEIQRFAIMEGVVDNNHLLQEYTELQIPNKTRIIMKNIFYGALTFLCVTLSCCAIVATHSYKISKTKPKVTVDLGRFQFEAIVNDEREGAEVCKKYVHEIKDNF